jgi:hypothetical protein
MPQGALFNLIGDHSSSPLIKSIPSMRGTTFWATFPHSGLYAVCLKRSQEFINGLLAVAAPPFDLEISSAISGSITAQKVLDTRTDGWFAQDLQVEAWKMRAVFA